MSYIFNSIWYFPREILLNKNAQVFYVDFRLETNIFILSYQTCKFWLVSKSLFGEKGKITKLGLVTR